MRVSTNLLQQQAINAIIEQQNRAARTQLQLATGRRILAPSEDPAASASVLDLAKVIDTTKQYQRNADAAESRLQVEEGTLGSMVDLLQRARVLMVQGANDSQNAATRNAIATEVREILDTMVGLANTKDGNGEYLFAGYKTGTVPITDDGAGTFTYNGDQGQRTLQIGPTRHIAVGDSGHDVFMKIPGATDDVFKVLYDMASELEANAPDATRLNDIDAAMNTIVNAQSRIGSRLNAIDSQRGVNDSAVLQFEQTRASLEGLDMAQAVSDLNVQMTGLQAAQQSYVRVQGLSLFNFL